MVYQIKFEHRVSQYASTYRMRTLPDDFSLLLLVVVRWCLHNIRVYAHKYETSIRRVRGSEISIFLLFEARRISLPPFKHTVTPNNSISL